MDCFALRRSQRRHPELRRCSTKPPASGYVKEEEEGIDDADAGVESSPGSRGRDAAVAPRPSFRGEL
jgi:hypothetical protein